MTSATVSSKRVLVLNGMLSETTYVCVYLRTKFQVSSIILTGFKKGGKRGGSFTPQKKTPKSPPRLGLINFILL